MVELFNNRGFTLCYNRIYGTYHVATPNGDKACYENPLEAWSVYIALLDAAVRRSIGDMLEATGRNRYTGEIKNG